MTAFMAIEHAETLDDEIGPRPPDGIALWCLVRTVDGCATWRRIYLHDSATRLAVAGRYINPRRHQRTSEP